MQADSGSGASQLEGYVEQIRGRLPAAPQNLIYEYVRWAPWVAIVFGVLGVLAFFGAAGIHAARTAPVESLLGIVLSVLDIAAGILMLQRRELGWWILAPGLAVGLLSDLLHVAVLSLVVTLLIAYVHIEARPEYH